LSDNDLRQAILLIKTGNKEQAQIILKSLLEKDLHDIHAWVWYVETLSTINQKIRALELCLRYNPDNERVKRGLATLKAYLAQPPGVGDQVIESDAAASKVCPFCGTRVDAYAEVCSYCGSDLVSRFRLPKFDIQLPSIYSLRRFVASIGYFFQTLGSIRSWGLLIFVLPAIGLLLIGLWFVRQPRSVKNNNRLAIGDLSKVESISLNIRASMEFDYLSKSEVIEMRKTEVYRYPELIYSGYEPYEGVFGEIIDGLPWWGIAGKFYYGQGEQSIEGTSAESRFILNPYLLVAAEPCGGWDKTIVPEEVIQRPGFVFYCPPEGLTWEPESDYAEVTYNAGCVARRGYSCFNLIAYNARDLNLGYIYVSYEDSINISKENRPDEPLAIPQYIHQGENCGFAEGCNTMSPTTPELDGLSVVGLPAQVRIWLWESEPESIDVTPDLEYVIRFR
jgi:hypothetical protein